MRRLITVACAVIFVDVAFFEAITPLLADYRNQLGLGEGEAGLLVGSYAVGSVLFSLPAGFAASRLGPRLV
ncbi:MAG TPA: MFS transporter, partial [Solirubrobacterales bacterium]|nr:MFS transporter [Solirubrobacterales bacterium]